MSVVQAALGVYISIAKLRNDCFHVSIVIMLFVKVPVYLELFSVFI